MWIMFLTMAWLLGISIMDIRKCNVSVWMLIPGGLLAVTAIVCRQGDAGDMLKGMLPGVFLLATAFATKKAGHGDGIVMMFLGILSGGGSSLLIFGISLSLAALVSLVLLVLRKAGKNTRIPFLPFLTAAWLITVAVWRQRTGG